jgi:type VI secretion system protein ImpC
MAKPFDFGEVKLTTGEDGATAVPSSETPFCIALLGDFSGRENRDGAEPETIGKRRVLSVDRDNFDEVLAKFAPEIRLPLGESELRLRFSELEDFHPDRLFENLDLFRRLREIRTRLNGPAKFASVAEELGLKPGGGKTAEAPRGTPTPIVAPSVTRLASGSLLDEMVEQTEARAPEDRNRRAPDEVREFARRAAEAHLVASADPRQGEILGVIDRALSGKMRALLHNPDFQALEAAWRAVFLLVRRLETDSQLKLFLIDISKAELAADLASQDFRSTGLYRLLVEKTVGTPGADPWAVIAGNYSFGPGRKDAELLSRLARVASAAGAPFIAGASPQIVGCGSFAATPETREWKTSGEPEGSAAWAALRRMNEAASIGLVLPRFLLRLPYGRKTDSIESFEFEEMAGAPAHEDYLWGNPAFAGALLLGQSFSQGGWEMRPGMISGIDGLPLHVYQDDGGSELKPCGEALLTDDAAEKMMESGLMPLASLKGRDTVRLVRFQSIADPLRALAGRWAA